MLAVHLENGAVAPRHGRCPRVPRASRCCACWPPASAITDLELQRGYYGFRGTPGHEFVAEVVEADDALARRQTRGGRNQSRLQALRLVPRGLGRHCPNRTVLGIVKHPGAFREFFTLPERNLHVLPDGIPTERAVFTEPLAAACEILDQVTIPRGAHGRGAGRRQTGLAGRAGAACSRLPVHQFGRHQRSCASRGAPALPPN